MTITNADVPALVDFLRTMDDSGKDGFREMVLSAEILDTTEVEAGL